MTTHRFRIQTNGKLFKVQKCTTGGDRTYILYETIGHLWWKKEQRTETRRSYDKDVWVDWFFLREHLSGNSDPVLIDGEYGKDNLKGPYVTDRVKTFESLEDAALCIREYYGKSVHIQEPEWRNI